MSEEYRRRNVMSEDEDARPVVEDPSLAEMDEGRVRPRRIRRRVQRMGDEPETLEMGVPRAGGNLMPPVSQIGGGDSAEPGTVLPDQEEITRATAAPEEGEQYVRLRLRVRDDQVTVVSARTVDGPLVAPDRLHAGLAFEVTRDQKQLGIGSIPDAGERRSFPPPDGDPERQGHHVAELPSYDFSVRVPRSEFSAWALPRLRVRVFRVKGDVPTTSVRAAPLSDQFDGLREVAQLQGIRLDDLPQDVREQVERAAR